MNRIVKLVKKNYIYVNITLFLLTIYVILFPFFAKILEKINPLLVQCPYLRATGKPCPLCGGTRYVSGLKNVLTDITYLFHPFGVMMIIIIFQFFYRIYNIATRKKEKSDRYVKVDLIILSLIVIGFILYEVIYLIIQNCN